MCCWLDGANISIATVTATHCRPTEYAECRLWQFWTSRKSRKRFIKCTEPINTMAKAARMELWRALGRQCAVLTNTFQLAQRTPHPLDNLEGTQPVVYTG